MGEAREHIALSLCEVGGPASMINLPQCVLMCFCKIISLCPTEVAVCLHASLTHQAGSKPAWQVGEVRWGGEGHAGELFALCISDSSSILDNLS